LESPGIPRGSHGIGPASRNARVPDECEPGEPGARYR
jgi:hypothetical protein